ncbi:hypothetical protein GJAV_G00261370 [Gymnothorax javanicus]|nr:hypothetical protein GJAV_G00261370 [Gymnothorax javanicus]
MANLPAIGQKASPTTATLRVELPHESEHDNRETDTLDSDGDSDSGSGEGRVASVDTDSEAESDSDAKKYREACLTDAESFSAVSHPDADTAEESTWKPRTEGDLSIHTALECRCDVMVCQFNDEGTILAVGLCDGSIKVYSPDNGSFVKTLRGSEVTLSPVPVTGLKFFHSNEAHSLLLATYANGFVRCWYVWGQDCLWEVKEVTGGSGMEKGPRQTLSLSISPLGEIAATGGSDSAIHLYDLRTHQRVHTCCASASRSVMDGHRFRIFAVNFHPEREKEFISGGWDDTVQFWDMRQQHSVRKLMGPHVCGDALQIDPVTNQILAGSWRKAQALEIFDYDSCQKISEGPHDPRGQSRIYTCHWLDQDYILAGGGQSNLLRIIDRQTLLSVSRLTGLPSAVFSSCVCPGGRWKGLIAASSGNRVILLKQGCLKN